ncbi:MAG: hypothetical protein EAZ92_14270 [Candidatus Kapaibacterium sp.]|nr:MAG: hypothetical protein EAZ92_14270 [Candidatus Kapabacteria bacterium]
MRKKLSDTCFAVSSRAETYGIINRLRKRIIMHNSFLALMPLFSAPPGTIQNVALHRNRMEWFVGGFCLAVCPSEVFKLCVVGMNKRL